MKITNYKSIIATILALLPCYLLIAQTGSLSGKITSEGELVP
jgi:hypothetical protein